MLPPIAIPPPPEAAIVKLGYVPVIVIFEPAVKETVWSGALFVIVKLGYVPEVDMPVPAVKATIWSGAVFVIVNVPLLVIGEPDIEIPVPAVAATLVTVPTDQLLSTLKSKAVPLIVNVLVVGTPPKPDKV
jgi:hypothetical protein